MNWGKYNLIHTKEALKKLDDYLIVDNKKVHDICSYDTETNGRELYLKSMIGFSISVDKERGFYIPLVKWIPDKNSLKVGKKVNKEPYDIYVDGHFECIWTGKIYEEFFSPKDYDMPDFIPYYIKRWIGDSGMINHNAPFDVNMTYVSTGVDLKDSVFVDTILLVHLLNENTPNGLKETSIEWKEELGIDEEKAANEEQLELTKSVIINGGEVTKSGKAKSIWRADLDVLCKYACADTFLTYGVYLEGIKKYIKEYGEDKLKWFFEDEVMPLCKEVVIDMKRKGVYIDVPYFEKLKKETKNKLDEIEDYIINELNAYLDDFNLSKSIENEITKTSIVKRIAKLENLKLPTKYDKKTDTHKISLAKSVVKRAYDDDPHWLWGYVIGEDEIKYSDNKLMNIKKELYAEKKSRRHAFNIGSDDHLRWLFFEKLKNNPKDMELTDCGKVSVKAEVLKKHFSGKYIWINSLLLYKKLKKLYGTYITPAVELNIDGWLYMNMRQNGTKSGRFACSGGLNLQTLPKVEEIDKCVVCKSKNVEHDFEIELVVKIKCKDCDKISDHIIVPSAIKKGFIAPPGMKIVSADYSSLEPRAFAFMSGDPKLKDVYKKDLDLYSKVYCDMFDSDNKYSPDPKAPNYLKTVYKKGRDMVKPIVLSIPYGATAYQIAASLNKTKIVKYKDGIEREVVDVEYGEFIRNTYLGEYSGLVKYMDDMNSQALVNGKIKSICGRIRHFRFTKAVFELMNSKGVDWESFMYCHNKKMKLANCNVTLSNGDSLILTKEDLQDFCKKTDLKYFNVSQKGCWDYVRGIFNLEMNNAKNWPIQTCAGHITNRGMLDTARGLVYNKVNGYIALQIHDEIMMYVDENQAELGSTVLKNGMEDNIVTNLLDIPMIAVPTICNSIKEAK